jgi:hypothetical protein
MTRTRCTWSPTSSPSIRSQTVRLRGPTRVVDLRVDDPEQFQLVAVGDQVEATFTEAVAISVEPAAETD